jgi:hypothetical protein
VGGGGGGGGGFFFFVFFFLWGCFGLFLIHPAYLVVVIFLDLFGVGVLVLGSRVTVDQARRFVTII